MPTIDIAEEGVRALNQRLQGLPADTNETSWEALNPHGAHAVAVGLELPISVEIKGHVGYYCGGMNKEATVVVDGHASQGVGENIMSGMVRVKGNASMAAGASGHGGMVVVEGDTSFTLRHLHERRRHRRWRFRRTYERVHGASRASRGLR